MTETREPYHPQRSTELTPRSQPAGQWIEAATIPTDPSPKTGAFIQNGQIIYLDIVYYVDGLWFSSNHGNLPVHITHYCNHPIPSQPLG
jgi:hypothetical protein